MFNLLLRGGLILAVGLILVACSSPTPDLSATIDALNTTIQVQESDLLTQEATDTQPPPTLHFGLGACQKAELTVRWPDGQSQLMEAVEADQILKIVEEGERRTTPLPEPAPEPESAPPEPGSE